MEAPNMKFHGEQFNGRRADRFGKTNGRTDEESDNISVEENFLWRYNVTSNDDMY